MAYSLPNSQGSNTFASGDPSAPSASPGIVTPAAFEDVRNTVHELRSLLLRLHENAASPWPMNETPLNLEDIPVRGRSVSPRRPRLPSVGVPMSQPPPILIPHQPGLKPYPSRQVRVVSSRSRSSSKRRRSPGTEGFGYAPRPLSPQLISSPQPVAVQPMVSSYRRAPSPARITFVPTPPRTSSPQFVTVQPMMSRRTDLTTRELDSVISDFSSIVIIATFLASVSIAILNLDRDLNTTQTALNKSLHVILQVFTSLSLSFNLSVAIVAGGAASSQSLRLRLSQRATEFTHNQALDTKLQLCSTMQYYGLLARTLGTACLFGLLVDSPYAILMIIPVIGVVFYDSLIRNGIGNSRRRENDY